MKNKKGVSWITEELGKMIIAVAVFLFIIGLLVLIFVTIFSGSGDDMKRAQETLDAIIKASEKALEPPYYETTMVYGPKSWYLYEKTGGELCVGQATTTPGVGGFDTEESVCEKISFEPIIKSEINPDESKNQAKFTRIPIDIIIIEDGEKKVLIGVQNQALTIEESLAEKALDVLAETAKRVYETKESETITLTEYPENYFLYSQGNCFYISNKYPFRTEWTEAPSESEMEKYLKCVDFNLRTYNIYQSGSTVVDEHVINLNKKITMKAIKMTKGKEVLDTYLVEFGYY